MIVTISNSILSAQINLKGAELVSLKNLQTNEEYIWEGNPFFWGKHSPILFPIVGTLKNNSYIYNEKKYQLLRHGFARDVNFQLISDDTSTATFSLKSSEESKKNYPFEFELQLNYTLLNNKLVFNYKVINLDSKEIPFSIGAHPAFALSENFENYALEFNHQETLKCFRLENDLVSTSSFDIELTDRKLPLTYTTFANDALIFKTLQSKSITILKNNRAKLKVVFEDFDNLGIWTKMGAPFICIEPWLGYSDTVDSSGIILEKEGIQKVKENCSAECQFYIEIL